MFIEGGSGGCGFDASGGPLPQVGRPVQIGALQVLPAGEFLLDDDAGLAANPAALNLQEEEREEEEEEEEEAAGEGANDSIENLHEHLANQLIIEGYERRFRVLATRFRRFMNFYGLAEDVNLLLVDTNYERAQSGSGAGQRHDHNKHDAEPQPRRPGRSTHVAQQTSGPRTRDDATSRRPILDGLARACWLAMIVVANALTVYMLVAHFAWELLRLDAKMSTYGSSGVVANSSGGGLASGASSSADAPATGNAAAVVFNGWSVLKDFIENLRRHLSRFFALVLVFIWHKNCHELELLFVDCRRYYAAFYPKLWPSSAAESRTELERRSAEARRVELSISHLDLGEPYSKRQSLSPLERRHGHLLEQRSARPAAGHLSGARRDLKSERDHQLQLIKATGKFYSLARKRISWGVYIPFAYLAMNMVGIILAPRALIIANNGQDEEGTPAQEAAHSKWWPFRANETHSGIALVGTLVDNFNSFHRAVHTAFHPFDHQIGDQARPESQLSNNWSALYSVAEMATHTLYINGPRIVCATCLSLIFSIHQQCMRAFNEHLVRLIRRPRDQPLAPSDMVKLLKQYDMIGMMHERIEQSFKWSLVSWFSVMFIGCLMMIYTLTESTSAVLGGGGGSPEQADFLSSGSLSVFSTICLAFILVARILYVCYAPVLIYAEAFKIESENTRASQLIMLLSRRQDDPVAQSIECGLFEPIQLSVGGYFSLSKRSVAPLLGAITTFSIMFMESPARDGPSGVAKMQRSADGSAPRQDEAADDEPADTIGEDDNEDEEANNEEQEEPDDEQDSAENELEPAPSSAKGRHAAGVTRPELESTSAAFVGRRQGMAPARSGARQQQQRRPAQPYRSPETAPVVGRQSRRFPGTRAPSQLDGTDQQPVRKASQWRKFKRLNRKIATSSSTISPQLAAETLQGPALLPAGGGQQLRPRLAQFYLGRIKENERLVSVTPKLRVENGVEICNFELRAMQSSAPDQAGDQRDEQEEARPERLPFAVSYIDRVQGEATIEASDLAKINCERQQKYEIWARAVGCNGQESNDALLTIELEDVNEFRPEFERGDYAVSIDVGRLLAKAHRAARLAKPDPDQEQEEEPANSVAERADKPSARWCHLLTVRAHDQDCSAAFGQVCRYELLTDQQQQQQATEPAEHKPAPSPADQQGRPALSDNLRIDSRGNLRGKCRWLSELARHQRNGSAGASHAAATLALQVVAFDCGGKKSLAPANVQIELADRRASHRREPLQAMPTSGEPAKCRPGWKDVDTQIAYGPASGERWPFQRARLDLCAGKCHRPNITVKLQLEATPSARGPQTGQTPQGRPSVFHCDRDPYAMVSKRRLCGARRKAVELLPPSDEQAKWIASLQQEAAASNRQADERADWPRDNRRADDQTEDTRPTAANDDEENLGAYLPDGSYGSLANEFAAQEKASSASGETSGLREAKPRAQRLRPGRSEAGARFKKSAVYRDQVYHFDGVDDVLLVPRFVYQSQLQSKPADGDILFGSKHTISFWMRHSEFKFKFERPHSNETAPETEEDQLEKLSRHVREDVICVGDRHPVSSRANSSGTLYSGEHRRNHWNHYALYLRNCKLNLLIRNEASQRHSSREPFEWRWSLDERGNQFCDNKWHLYTLNVNYPSQVELFVDGQQFNNEKRYASPASLDWARHLPASAQRVAETVLSVGACYDARSRSMIGHFRGSLSGLSLVMNANDEANSIECLGHCTESLVSVALQNDQQQRQSALQVPPSPARPDNSLVSYQESQDRIKLQGHDQLDIEEALAQIAYVNRRQLPSVGRRTVELHTQVGCANAAHHPHPTNGTNQTPLGDPAAPVAIEPIAISIDVLPSVKLPTISISGTPNLAREHLPLVQGRVAPFESLRVQVRQLSLPRRSERPVPVAVEGAKGAAQRGNKAASPTGDLLDYIDDGNGSADSPAKPKADRSPQQASQPSVSLESSENLASAGRRVESCHLELRADSKSPLDALHESLHLPVKLLTELDLYWRQSKWAALIYGLDTAENYEALLRSILYQNTRPSQTSERLFRLVCSDMSGRLLSNEYVQRVTVIHPRPKFAAPAAGDEAFAADQAALLNVSELTSVVSGPADDRRYDSLRSHQAPELSLRLSELQNSPNDSSASSAAQLDSAFNRVALGFTVFVVAAVLTILGLAMFNFKSVREEDQFRRQRRLRRRASRQAMRLRRRHELDQRGFASIKQAASDESDCERAELQPEAELNSGSASSMSEDDEFTTEVSSGESCEDAENVPSTSKSPFDCRLRRAETASRSRGERCECADTERSRDASSKSVQSSIEIDSLSWDDEINLRSAGYRGQASGVNITVNPILHRTSSSSLSMVDQANIKRPLIASIKRPHTNERAQSHLVRFDSDETLRAPIRRTMIIDELIPMDENFCSGSQTCSSDEDADDLEEERHSCSDSGGEVSDGFNRKEACSKPGLGRCGDRKGRRVPRQLIEPLDNSTIDNDYDETTATEIDEDLEQNVLNQNGEAQTEYNLYHAHHFHHPCLRRQRQQSNLRSAVQMQTRCECPTGVSTLSTRPPWIGSSCAKVNK